MIYYKNFQRKLRNREEEIQAVRYCNGKAKTDGEVFEVIECVLSRPSVSPVKKHGWQDTEIHVARDGAITIADYEAGRGILRFEPSRYGNPVAYLARSEWNMQMLVKHYRTKEWSIADRHVAEEVKKSYEIWWEKLPKAEKQQVVEREELGKRDQFSIPSESRTPDTDSAGKNLLAELAAEKEKNRQLEAANAQLQSMKAPATETKEPEVEAAPAPVEKLKPGENPDLIVKDRGGKTHNFNNMLMFDVQKVARKRGVLFKNETLQPTLVQMIIQDIKEEKKKQEA
jgi:hypothetical protein